jgi:hypothetical protein
MPLLYDAFKAWILSLNVENVIETALNQGPYIPDMPAALVTYTMLPGLGIMLDGAADSIAFQQRVRSEPFDQSGAEKMAYALDTAMLSAQFPVQIAGALILLVDRSGGQPAPLGPPDNGDRFDYVSTYRALVGR